MDKLCRCGKVGKLCNWAESDEDLCKMNNNSASALYLCRDCAHWRCKVCDIRMCLECYKEMRDTDSTHSYLEDSCLGC